jgi:hypothetical protein
MAASAGAKEQLQLQTLDLTPMTSGWQSPQTNRAVSGQPLRVGEKRFESGIGTHAPSELRLSLDGKATRLRASLGVDAAAGSAGSVEFKVVGDGVTLWQSGKMTGRSPLKSIDVELTGVKRLDLIVTDAGDGRDSDHANWIDPTIEYAGSAPAPFVHQFPALAEHPEAPPNEGLAIKAVGHNAVEFLYAGRPLLKLAGVNESQVELAESTGKRGEVTQTVRLVLPKDSANAIVLAGEEAIAAETRGPAQSRLPLVRTSHGPSHNLRNNAIYDRTSDWMLEAPHGAKVMPSTASDGGTQFTLDLADGETELVFRPRYYQKHKNLPFYQPWTYSVRKDSITGWCSWWAYRRECSQQDVDRLMKVWNEQRLGDYGYRFIQLDDAFQGGDDQGRPVPAGGGGTYIGGRPETWLKWQRNLFPQGLDGYVESVREHGFIPALWMGCFFTDERIANEHPDWFVQGPDGKPFVGDWVTYVVDATNPEAADALIRPTFRGLKQAGLEYVKIDQLRHMIYDNLNQNFDYMAERGIRPDDIFRAYLRIAREELGDDCFILSCWGVLLESIGLADACRIAGDGYGPVSLQQYNSWNGIVWINDPDHCDIRPRVKGVGQGNVLTTEAVEAADSDSIIRPALASIAGGMLMLSDRADTYADTLLLEGAKRSSPVLWSVPGQLYDFDPQKTDLIRDTDRLAQVGGSSPASIDADQFGEVCPLWLNEFHLGFDHWQVLHRLNWPSASESSAADQAALPEQRVSLADLGLDPTKEYIAFNFWNGEHTLSQDGTLTLPPLAVGGIQSFALRELLDRPQLVSTSRHLSQGAAELEALAWNADTRELSGRSRVVADDPYTLTLRVPKGYSLVSAKANGEPLRAVEKNGLWQLTIESKKTMAVDWQIQFDR